MAVGQEIQVIYYPIREDMARRAKEMNSFSGYIEGTATAEYRRCVDQAVEAAKHQKEKVDPIYHGKIDALVDTYARKLADNMNRRFEIDARVPSVMVAGPANFPTGKKEKQNAAGNQNMEEWRQVQGILDKIKSTGMGGIRADHPHAVEQLEQKLKGLEQSQQTMKEVNAYYRKHKTLDGSGKSILQQAADWVNHQSRAHLVLQGELKIPVPGIQSWTGGVLKTRQEADAIRVDYTRDRVLAALKREQ